MSDFNIDTHSRLDLFKQGMAVSIKAMMPKLKDVVPLSGRFNLDELKNRSIKAPAAFPTVLKSSAIIRADRSIWIKANCAVFFVAEGREDKRDRHCSAMAVAFMSRLANNSFGMSKIGAPTNLEIDPLISAKTGRAGVTIIAVTWKQEIKDLGNGLFDDELVLLQTLYVNDEEDPHYEIAEGSNV